MRHNNNVDKIYYIYFYYSNYKGRIFMSKSTENDLVKTKHTLMIVVDPDDADYFKTEQSIFKKQGISASYVFKQFVNAYKQVHGDN